MPKPRSDTPQVKVIDGVECTDRAGVAILAGMAPGNSVHVRAASDPDFPTPISQQRIERKLWYPLERVETYVGVLAAREEDRKPPPVKDGDPGELLDTTAAADALHIEVDTLYYYVSLSKSYWEGEVDGQPILPKPDVEETRQTDTGREYTHREWRRATLAAHQSKRPGLGAGAGRPPGT